ncbi:MAG: GntR family transcriptional regulator [Natronohydrobacter sp.]|nr:GntR family transcriptional regulator [Natronohydrobacter sp.]
MHPALKPTDPIAPQLVSALRRSIAELELPPGSTLSEKDVALRFNVSRQPVREAFIKLSEAGLVEIRPSRGTWVMKISVREVCNARFVREGIEAELASHAARLARREHIATLSELIAAQRDAAEAGDYARFNGLDEAFHRTIADIVGNDFARRIVETARFQTDRVRLLSLPAASPMQVLIGQHQTILECIAKADGDGAAIAMRRHLREILLALPSIAAAYPEYFTDTELPDHAVALVPQTAVDSR